ncbi:hypothetical protein [Ferrimicrobium acidiphilum]|jgi:hypothetical protein|uniref:Uncharacterized protein n=1 Tax=Ferrimicrobium acidiphilum DSM 19497 TaxID=1121877 RepID=A0A0D8FSJ9_9ACTN|nr:hypothetical protein [Ferrimicrobium acidiphilum]KJE76121.1 hypothetical protein FEAC_21030 [Ferrimicrobium acidiphilum DSM 19497]
MGIRERMYPEETELPALLGHCADVRYVLNLVRISGSPARAI